MTENEAIEMLNNIQVDTRDLKHALKCSELIETAVKALEEVQEYRKLGTVEEVREAVEKAKAKKIKYFGRSKRSDCPTCKQCLGWNYIMGYCKYCGQRLEREE